MLSLLHTFCLHFYLINIHIFDYPDSRLSGLFTAVPTSPDNRGSTVRDNMVILPPYDYDTSSNHLGYPINETNHRKFSGSIDKIS